MSEGIRTPEAGNGQVGALSGWLRDTLALFENSAEELLGAISAEVQQLPEYRRLSEPESDSVGAAAGLVFATLTGCLSARRRHLSPSEREKLMEVGRLRAQQGVPLRQMVQGFRIGFRLSEQRLRRIVDEHPPPDPSESAALFGMLPALHTDAEVALREGHAAEQMEGVPPSRGRRATLLEAVLDGGTEDDLHELASLLGRSAESDCALLVATLLEGRPLQADPYRLANALAAAPGTAGVVVRLDPLPHVVVLALRDGEPAPMDTAGLEQVADRFQATPTVAVGRLDELGPIYTRLAPLLPVAGQLTDGGHVLSLAKLDMFSRLAVFAAEEAYAFARDAMGTVQVLPPRKDTDVWLRTLDMYLAVGNVRDVARRIPCDPKTVYAHLDHIEELTGLDARNPPHALILALSRLFTRLHHFPPRGDPSWLPDSEG